MKTLLAFLISATALHAQTPPSTETLILSLRTVAKAATGCREVYDRKAPGTSSPILKVVLDPDSYAKDMKNLEMVEKLTETLSSHPERITGKSLVAVLSTMDDLSVSAGSSRFEVVSAAITNKVPSINNDSLFLMSEGLNTCQKNLFNAGDDYVDLVMNYVGAQDEALTARRSKP